MKRVACGLLLGCVALLGGCVERRMIVVSDPPGALVRVNGTEIGATPVSVPTDLFEYYGTYEFTLIKDGYEPLLVKQPVPAPCYEYFPLDFFAENVWPARLKDQRVFTYQLSPVRIVAPEEVLNNANNLRGRAGTAAPPVDAPATPPMVPPVNDRLPPSPTPAPQP